MDLVFKALADSSRRLILDELFKKDGQTLAELTERFSMTRFGVMKHVQVLQDAGLVVARKRGREKLHFLNTVPIRLVHDRWVSKYAAAWAAGLSDLKSHLERSMEKVFEIYIKTTPERVWEAITSPEMRAKFTFGAWVESSFANGSKYKAVSPDKAFTIFDGENIEVDPPRKLVQTFNAQWGDDVKSEGTSRVTWEIEQIQDSCLVRVTHDQLREGANNQLYGGWSMVLSGLKTLLESGELLTTPGSLMYANPTTWRNA